MTKQSKLPVILTDVDKRVAEAVKLRAQGLTWKQVSDQIPGTQESNLRRQCISRGYEELPSGERRELLASTWGQVAALAADQTLDALVDGKISTGHLPVVGGIATDKVVKLEGWDRNQDSGAAQSLLELMAENLKGTGAELTLKVTHSIDAEVIEEDES